MAMEDADWAEDSDIENTGVPSTNLQQIEHDFAKDSFNIDEIRPRLKTAPNTAFFWSGKTDGIGGSEIAETIAKGNNGITLESIVRDKGLTMPEWDFSDPSSMDAWDMASAAYAEQVSGEVRAVVGSNLRPGSIWENVEFPRLLKNPNVTKIILIDPKTGKETTVFVR